MGVGGSDRYYREPARLIFLEEALGTVSCFLDIDIWSPDPKRFEQLIPPLLGRDFLNLCDVRLNYSTGVVVLEPVDSNEHGEMPPS